MSLSDDELELVRENVEELSDMSDQEIRDLQSGSWLSEKLFVVYVLSEAGLSQKEIAELSGYDSRGTVSNYRSRIEDKFEKTDRTDEVRSIFE